MFVDIEDFKGAIAVENILMPYKKGRLSSDKKSRLPKEPITPQVCMDILKSTNYARNIKDMLLCITELPQEEQAQFKDVVIATFDNREQPQTILDLGQELAQASGYMEEFEQVQKIEKGDVILSDSTSAKVFTSNDMLFLMKDFSAYQKVICLYEGEITFYKDVKFPKILECPNASKVDLTECDLQGLSNIILKKGACVDLRRSQNLPPQLDVSMCTDVCLAGCDLSPLSHLAFAPEACVDLRNVKNLPPQLDVSKCSRIFLEGCDLSAQPNLAFAPEAEVNFKNVRNLPPDLDFSHCQAVVLSGCDLSNQADMFLYNGAVLLLNRITNIPPRLDFSVCSKVQVSESDLSGCEKLDFREGAKVTLLQVYKFPEEVDFSKCAEVIALECDFSAVKKLVLKNHDQIKYIKSCLQENWNGEIVYTQAEDTSAKNANGLANAQKNVKKFLGKLFGKGGR